MKGLELSRLYYEEYGKPMIEEQFGEYKDRIAVGLCGHGSECFGFDDKTSQDHDFEPGFCLWLTNEDEKLFGFKLFRAYSKLPKEFMGFKVQKKSLFGGDFKGVHTINEFYSFYTPCGDVPQGIEEWMAIPDSYLAEATNGEVFYDGLGEFTSIRNRLINERPLDVRLAKLASAVFYMAQAGQYNYSRCVKHGENGAAAFALNEFAKNTLHAVYLLNDGYMPYYKWAFRGALNFPVLCDVAEELTEILGAPYNAEKNRPIIERLSAKIVYELANQGLSDIKDEYLEPHAYCIKDKIKDSKLRNSPIML